jgi:NADPH-dependent glutamate synthase beta subunit-like oxidoreductase
MQDVSDAREAGFDFGRAYAEASRCLLCHDAPCSKGCPAGTDPATFIRKLRLRNVKGAIRTIKQNNILGGACGALCPTARLCEAACCASGIDRPVRIGAIQQFLVHHAWQIGFQPLVRGEARAWKVAVVGAGPAGLSCAATLAMHGCAVTVFEARAKPGGVLAFGVPGWRLPPSSLDREVDDLRALGVEIRCLSPVTSRGAAEALLSRGFGAVFLGPGCWEPARLSSEEVPGVLTSTAVLAALREGKQAEVSRSVADKVVAVLGGGSVAMDCVQVCHRLGAREVYLVYRRSYAQMPAEEDERLEALHAGTHFLLLNQPVGYVRGPTGALAGVRLVRTRLGGADAKGRAQPQDIPGTEWTLDAQIAIEALGAGPMRGSPEWYPSVKVDARGLVRTDPSTGMTSVPGIFAGGDIVSGPALVVTAVRDGKAAARAILEYLGKEGAR